MNYTTIIWFKKYGVIQELGKGAYGTVFLARHEKLNTLRAIKRMRKSEAVTIQVMNEANILKNLRHPNIPIIYDMEEDETYVYIIEEYVEGQSLRTIRFDQSYIQENKIVGYLLQLCDVLNFLHSKEHSILYLDLKPENIMISNETIKLIDFGTAIFAENVQTRKQSFGTRGYAAPEQYGLKEVDKRSDIYGLGCVMYFLITGKGYNGTSGEWKKIEQNLYCSKKLKQIVKKCLRFLPIQRYQSIPELRKHLESILEGKSLVKKQEKIQQNTPHRIAVAGNLSRIGTTHICLMIASYLNQKGILTLYMETNENQVIQSLRRVQGTKEPFPMARGAVEDLMERYPECQVFIGDYGVLTPEMLEMKEAEQKFFVMGSKPWEETMVRVPVGIECLFNFTRSTDFFKQTREFKGHKCHRVPFESDYLHPRNHPAIKGFMEELLEELG